MKRKCQSPGGAAAARQRCAPGVLGKHARPATPGLEHETKRRRLVALEEELLFREQNLLTRENNLLRREAAVAERERWVLQLQRQTECNGPAPPWLHAVH